MLSNLRVRDGLAVFLAEQRDDASVSSSRRCFSSLNATLVYASISSAVLCGANVSTKVFSEIAASVAASAGVAIRMITATPP